MPFELVDVVVAIKPKAPTHSPHTDILRSGKLCLDFCTGLERRTAPTVPDWGFLWALVPVALTLKSTFKALFMARSRVNAMARMIVSEAVSDELFRYSRELRQSGSSPTKTSLEQDFSFCRLKERFLILLSTF